MQSYLITISYSGGTFGFSLSPAPHPAPVLIAIPSPQLPKNSLYFLLQGYYFFYSPAHL